jgi:hypothetical protein
VRRALAGLLALSAVAAHAETPVPRRLDGTELPPPAGARALMFWRADCPPCLVELRNAAAYIEAAGGRGRVLFVGLQEEGALRRAAARFGVPPDSLARAEGDPRAILESYGGAASLPRAVVTDASGRICFRRDGLLGTDALKQAMTSCGAGDARH